MNKPHQSIVGAPAVIGQSGNVLTMPGISIGGQVGAEISMLMRSSKRGDPARTCALKSGTLVYEESCVQLTQSTGLPVGRASKHSCLPFVIAEELHKRGCGCLMYEAALERSFTGLIDSMLARRAFTVAVSVSVWVSSNEWFMTHEGGRPLFARLKALCRDATVLCDRFGVSYAPYLHDQDIGIIDMGMSHGIAPERPLIVGEAESGDIIYAVPSARLSPKALDSFDAALRQMNVGYDYQIGDDTAAELALEPGPLMFDLFYQAWDKGISFKRIVNVGERGWPALTENSGHVSYDVTSLPEMPAAMNLIRVSGSTMQSIFCRHGAGVGLVFVLSPRHAERFDSLFETHPHKPIRIGVVRAGGARAEVRIRPYGLNPMTEKHIVSSRS